MPIFEIGLPDGRTMEAEAPDEATALRGAQDWFAQNAGGRSAATPATAGDPIVVEVTNGDTVEFPAGTSEEVILGALRRHYPPSQSSPKGVTQEVQPPSFFERMRTAITGERRAEFPNAPEFYQALPETGVASRATALSEVSPDENAQLDILRSRIPGLEHQRDARGNLMLRAPQHGVTEWSYLNTPGLSRRDVSEFLTQTAATLPFLAAAGPVGGTVARTALRSGVALGAGEVAKDLGATAAGSDQGVDPLRAAAATVLGGITAPGVPTALVQGAGRAATAIPNRVRALANPDDEAARRIGGALERDAAAGNAQLTQADEALASQTGAPVMTIDHGGDTARALLRSAANTSPEGRGTATRELATRFETQAERVSEFLRQTVGPPGNAHTLAKSMNQTRTGTLSPLYERAYREGKDGIYTPGLGELAEAPALQDAMRRAEQAITRKRDARTLLTARSGPTGMPTLEYWDRVARQLYDDLSAARTSGNRELSRDIGDLRSRLLDELDAAFPTYRQARTTAASFFRASDALEAGENFAVQSFGRAEAREAVAAMSPNEQLMFRQGYASRLLERVENTGDRRSVITQVVGSPAAREKLEIALGPQAAREMEAFMRVETLMDLPRQALGNSTTARQLAELGMAGGFGLLASGFDPTSPTAWIVAALTFGGKRGFAHIDQRVAQRVAEMLVSQDPAVRQNGLRQITRGGNTMLQSLRAFDERMSGPLRALAGQQLAGATAAGLDDSGQPAPDAGTPRMPRSSPPAARASALPSGFIMDVDPRGSETAGGRNLAADLADLVEATPSLAKNQTFKTLVMGGIPPREAVRAVGNAQEAMRLMQRMQAAQ